MTLDLIFTGIGGQGVVVLSDIFCEAALLDGFDVAKAEIHGMAQRGGSISAHVRVGEKVLSPLIEQGKADVIVGFEVLETARALTMLKPQGTVIVNTKYIPPSGQLVGSTKPLTTEALLAIIQEGALKVHQVDGLALAGKLGNFMVVNTILLGAVSALPNMPLKEASFQEAIASRLKEKYIKLNLKAFQLGRENVLLV
ncbi:MAG: indolepyruvate oxidoreductase subunit beta [Candidatus Bathyarchaeota archaeon]|nr:indolepyruvate oxidoreductase subunit beta [Candidatus Bathyarchaeota archaeon]